MRPEAIDLLALPCAGGTANMYAHWRRLLPAWIRLVPVELPGRGMRMAEPFAHKFDELVTRLCTEHAGSLGGRHALLGHSMGALLAHGMAWHQKAPGGMAPLALFVSASASPRCRAMRPRAFPVDDAGLEAELRMQGGTPEEVLSHPELRRMALDMLRADHRLCASYRHTTRAPLAMPIHAMAGRFDDLAASEVADWRRETTGRMSVHWFDGGHFFIRPHEAEVLQLIVGVLAQQAADAADGAAAVAA